MTSERRSMKKVLDDARAMEAKLAISEHPIEPEVIRAMEATIHDFTQYRGGYERLTPDERAEVMEKAIRAADEKRGFAITPKATALMEAEGMRLVVSVDGRGLRLDTVPWPTKEVQVHE